jgi:hypothetical protein
VAHRSLSTVVRAAVVAGFALMFAAQTAAAATPARVRVTTSNPYANCTIGSGPPEWGTVNYPGAEVEPMVAVNPANQRNIIGVVQQDRWNDGGAHGLVAFSSKDGGATFKVVPLPFSSCAPNGLPYERASDPWVSVGPDGTAYAVGLSFDENSTRNAIGAATSTDGGRTWKHVTAIGHTTDFYHDKQSVTADPVHAGTAYIVWDRSPVCCAYPAPSFMSKTTDYGHTWGAPQQITGTNSNSADLGNVIVIDPRTGTMYDFMDRFFKSSGLARYIMIKSTDGGAHWSSPVGIALDRGIQDVDPHGGDRPQIRDGWEIISAAIDPASGRLYAVWQDARHTSGQLNQVLISTSADGSSWSTPTTVSTTQGQAAFTGTVAVNDQGQVAVTYYDFRTFDPNRERLPTSYWMRISPAGGAAFGPDIAMLKEPFNMHLAPDAAGLFTGDYQGLAARGSTFVSIYCATKQHLQNRTDCYVSQVPAP